MSISLLPLLGGMSYYSGSAVQAIADAAASPNNEKALEQLSHAVLLLKKEIESRQQLTKSAVKPVAQNGKPRGRPRRQEPVQPAVEHSTPARQDGCAMTSLDIEEGDQVVAISAPATSGRVNSSHDDFELT